MNLTWSGGKVGDILMQASKRISFKQADIRNLAVGDRQQMEEKKRHPLYKIDQSISVQLPVNTANITPPFEWKSPPAQSNPPSHPL